MDRNCLVESPDAKRYEVEQDFRGEQRVRIDVHATVNSRSNSIDSKYNKLLNTEDAEQFCKELLNFKDD